MAAPVTKVPVTKTTASQLVTYVARFPAPDGRVATYTIQKSPPGTIEFTVKIVGDLRTWQQFCATIDRDDTIILG